MIAVLSSNRHAIKNTRWINERSKSAGVKGDEYISKQENVPIITLDEYCKKNNIGNIDIIKIDTQGYEDKVLKGCSELIKNDKINLIQVELIFADIYEKSLNFYDIDAQEIISTAYQNDYLSKVSYSPNGQMVVGCYLHNSGPGLIRSTTVFNETSGEVMWTKVTTPPCRDIAWSPDSSLIAIAYNWAPEHRDENGHPVFDYNGPYVDVLVSSSGSYFDQLNDICMSIYHCASITSLDWHPDSQSIIAGGNSNLGFTNPIGPSPNHIVGVVSSWYFDPGLEAIFGCMDEKSSNYNPLANASDYSCLSYYGTTQTDGSNNQYDSENGITPVNVDDLLDDSSRTQTEPIIQWIRNILFIAVCIGFVILLLGANRYKR